VNLEDVRRGALELLREQITTNPERAPDVGLAQVHESAGAIAVGARPFLIAFNVILGATTLPSRARSRARSERATAAAVRQSPGISTAHARPGPGIDESRQL
jgi:glutamate formiminotransferase